MSKHPIGTSRNGKHIYAHLTNSIIAQTLSRQPRLGTLLAEALSGIDLTEPTIHIEHDMGRSVGYAEIVATKPEDTIFYAQQVRTKTYTKFVKNRKAESTQYVSFSLQQDDAGEYEVTWVNIGKASPSTPDQTTATDASSPYWDNHAVVYNGQPLITSSITKTSPFESVA